MNGLTTRTLRGLGGSETILVAHCDVNPDCQLDWIKKPRDLRAQTGVWVTAFPQITGSWRLRPNEWVGQPIGESRLRLYETINGRKKWSLTESHQPLSSCPQESTVFKSFRYFSASHTVWGNKASLPYVPKDLNPFRAGVGLQPGFSVLQSKSPAPRTFSYFLISIQSKGFRGQYPFLPQVRLLAFQVMCSPLPYFS